MCVSCTHSKKIILSCCHNRPQLIIWAYDPVSLTRKTKKFGTCKDSMFSQGLYVEDRVYNVKKVNGVDYSRENCTRSIPCYSPLLNSSRKIFQLDVPDLFGFSVELLYVPRV